MSHKQEIWHQNTTRKTISL